ncbi:MAG: ATP-binding protein [Neomegalonema sp.]|nr:ATP-binding protein [Neomegalonema sp.]
MSAQDPKHRQQNKRAAASPARGKRALWAKRWKALRKSVAKVLARGDLQAILPIGAATLVAVFLTRLDPTAIGQTIGITGGILLGIALRVLYQAEADAPPMEKSLPVEIRKQPDPAISVLAERERNRLAQKLALWRAALQTLPQPVLILNRSGEILLCNPAAERFFGRSLQGNNMRAVLRAPRILQAVDAVLQGAAGESFAFMLRRQVDRNLEAHVLPIAAQVGEVEPDTPRVLVKIEDHTRMVRAEMLRQDFVANASHELKTPLASVLGMIETLKGPARKDPAAQERFLRYMEVQARRMQDLIEDLLVLNRIEVDEHVPPDQVVQIKRVVEEALIRFEANRGRAVSFEIDWKALGELAPVLGEERQLIQVFVNLFDNALKYAPSERELRVYVEPSQEGAPRVAVTVQDFGPGIPKEEIPRLQERFFRGARPNDEKLPGTGLGLAIVKHILARHRGELKIRSELGRGSWFTVVLPKPASDGNPRLTPASGGNPGFMSASDGNP